MARKSQDFCFHSFVSTVAQSSTQLLSNAPLDPIQPLPPEALADSLRDILSFYSVNADELLKNKSGSGDFDGVGSTLTFELGKISLSIQSTSSARIALTIPSITPPSARKVQTLKEYIEDLDHLYFPTPIIELKNKIENPKLSDVFSSPYFVVSSNAEDEPTSLDFKGSTDPFLANMDTNYPTKELVALFHHPHLQPPLAILETSSFCAIAYPTLPCLQSTLSFQRDSLSEFQLQFISFQLQRLQKYFDHFGIKCDCYDFRHIYLQDGWWVQFRLPTLYNLKTNSSNLSEDKYRFDGMPKNHLDSSSNEHTKPYDVLDTPFMSWLTGKLSNFDYLLYLNHLAGRIPNDCHSHPIMPWTTDFLSPSYLDQLKDFSKTQYRRKKGDEQLNMTFQSDLPHHLTTFLTDLSYFTYKARISPKSCLSKHVRSKYAPSEFPSSIALLFKWTADECIPEFYNSPTILMSCHKDMPPLTLPSWATSPTEFIVKHRHILESEAISEVLHEWIDLVFGYKLQGRPAEEAKNVVLALAHPEHSKLTPFHSVQQLFYSPHPKRFSLTSLEEFQKVSKFYQLFPRSFTLPKPTHPALSQVYHAIANPQPWHSTSLCSDAYVVLLHQVLSHPHVSVTEWMDRTLLKMNQSDFKSVFQKHVLHSQLQPTLIAKYFGREFLTQQIWSHVSRCLLNDLHPSQFTALNQLCVALGPFLTVQIVFPFLLLLLKKTHTIDQAAFSQFFADLATCFGVGFTQHILMPFLLSECKLHYPDALYNGLQHILQLICTSINSDLLFTENVLEYIKTWSLSQNHPKPVLLWLNIVQAIQTQHPGSMNSQLKNAILEKYLVSYLSLASKSTPQQAFHISPILLAYTMLCRWIGQEYVQSTFSWIKEIEKKIRSITGTLPVFHVSPFVLHMPTSFDIEDKASGEVSTSPQKRYPSSNDERRKWHFLLSSQWPSGNTKYKNQKLITFLSHSPLRSMNVSSNSRVLVSGGRDRTVKIWNLNFYKYLEDPNSNPLLGTYSGHSNVVREICFLDPYAATCDGSIRLWDIGTTNTIRHIHTKSPLRMIQSWPDSRLLIGISRNNYIFIDDIRTKIHPIYFSTGLSNSNSLRCTAIDSSRGLIAVGTIGGMISVLDLRTGGLLSSWKAHDTEISHLHFNKDVLVSSAPGHSSLISVWNISGFSPIRSIKISKLHSIDFLEGDATNELLAMDQSGHLAFVPLTSTDVQASVKLNAKKYGSWSFFRNCWDGSQRFLFAAAQDGNVHCFF